MHNLLAFLTKYYHWFIFLLLEVASGVMLFRYNSYQGSVWISSANAVVGKVYEWQAGLEQYFSLVDQNAALTHRNLVLEQQLKAYKESAADAHEDSVQSLQTMMGNLGKYSFVQAKVVSNSIDKTDNLITIDRGTEDGVEATILLLYLCSTNGRASVAPSVTKAISAMSHGMVSTLLSPMSMTYPVMPSSRWASGSRQVAIRPYSPRAS